MIARGGERVGLPRRELLVSESVPMKLVVQVEDRLPCPESNGLPAPGAAGRLGGAVVTGLVERVGRAGTSAVPGFQNGGGTFESPGQK